MKKHFLCAFYLNIKNYKKFPDFIFYTFITYFQVIFFNRCEKFCYDLPSTKMARSCAFGFGTKTDFKKIYGTAVKVIQ